MNDISADAYLARLAIVEAAAFIAAPHARMRPALSRDGNLYCALYGENLHEGCAGFGESPDLAMRDFDRHWYQRMGAAQARKSAAQIARDQISDDPQPGNWNDACEHIAKLLEGKA